MFVNSRISFALGSWARTTRIWYWIYFRPICGRYTRKRWFWVCRWHSGLMSRASGIRCFRFSRICIEKEGTRLIKIKYIISNYCKESTSNGRPVNGFLSPTDKVIDEQGSWMPRAFPVTQIHLIQITYGSYVYLTLVFTAWSSWTSSIALLISSHRTLGKILCREVAGRYGCLRSYIYATEVKPKWKVFIFSRQMPDVLS